MGNVTFEVSTENPYNITGRCLNRDWFAVPLPIVWEILSDYLHFVSRSYDIQIHLFVLMANHFHLMASSPTGSLSQAMQYFMAQTSRALAKEANRINHIWGARFYRCEIQTHHHFLNAYKYNYRNPVSVGIVDRPEDYRFSSLHGLLGKSPLTIPLVEDATLFSDVEGTLIWLNSRPADKNWDAVRKGLRRRVFELPKVDSLPHRLEIDLL